MGAFDHVDDPRDGIPKCDCSIRDYSDERLQQELVRRQEYRDMMKKTLANISSDDLKLELERRGVK
jgi:hypothetical protein